MHRPLMLVINLGATSSKFALYKGDEAITEQSIPLADEYAKLPLAEQRGERLNQLNQFIAATGFDPAVIEAVAARGGLTKPLAYRGIYKLDADLLTDLATEKYGAHASNLSSLIGYDWAQQAGLETPVYIVDPVNTDTLWDEARVSGVPSIERQGRHHALNVHRVARAAALRLGKPLHLTSLVVAHFGSGVSICSVVGGRTVDVNDAQLGEGPFSVSRAGTLPLAGVLQLVAQTEDPSQLKRQLSRESGMVAFTGTADFREIEKLIHQGDSKARLAYEAMVFQSAKYIAAYAGSLGERPDAIVLTGGLANSEMFTRDLTDRIDWLAPVELIPGEDELGALAEGVSEALSGSEPIYAYATAPTKDTTAPRNFKEVLNRAMGVTHCKFVVSGGHHPEVAETVKGCLERGITGFTLVGPAKEIEAQLTAESVPLDVVDIVDSEDVEADAIRRVLDQPGSVLVKGACNTKTLLGGVLRSLPEDSTDFLSHVAIIENPMAGRLLGVTDGGLNIDLDLVKKIGIMQNAITLFRALGVTRPQILLAAGMEDKGQDFPAIADAREIVARNRAGEWPQAFIDGPYGIDVALSTECAVAKGIYSPLAGHTDIIVTPNLESCNFAVKCVTLFTGKPWGGLVMGGPFPIVIGSRSDDATSRVCSIALAQLVSHGLANICCPARHAGAE